MANGSKGNLGNNLTALVVALLGAVSAIGGAWITTYGGNSANRTEAAAASTAVVAPKQPSDAPASPAAPVAAQPSVVPTPSAAPVQDAAPAFLPNSKQIAYGEAWPNDQRARQLVLESVEVAENVVRVHLRFDNTGGGSVKFYTAIGGQGVRSYISDKKEPQYPATGSGGQLFADPAVVEIAAGASKRGWIEYATGGAKLNTLNLHLESYTEGYPAGQSGTIRYDPIRLKVEK
jgi:hypothetical protein